MEEKNVQTDVTTENAADAETEAQATTDANAPILPGEEYAAKVAEEDPEELERVRSKLMTLILVKCKAIDSGTIRVQIKPMVYSMSIADCENMYKAISQHGLLGLTRMVMSHNREVKKENAKK